jgi:NADPH-dependent curcumin reductase
MQNHRVLLRSRPAGIAQADNFMIDATEITEPKEGQIVVRNAFLSVEPAMRGWIADTDNYSAAVPIGSVMRALAAGHVVAPAIWTTARVTL